ncbi:MAG: hypothetical protein JJT78_02280 [Leptospira sp.]|nr:hypothetical protein [Leptospira sp.]
MKIKYRIIYIFVILALISNCNPGDIMKVDKQVDRFFEIKKSGNYQDLQELIHSKATSDLNPTFFQNLNSKKKNYLGDYISHEREKFNYNASGGNKLYSIVYKVKYSKVEEFWEKFVFRNDSDGTFKLVGYAANEKRENLGDKD